MSRETGPSRPAARVAPLLLARLSQCRLPPKMSTDSSRLGCAFAGAAGRRGPPALALRAAAVLGPGASPSRGPASTRCAVLCGLVVVVVAAPCRTVTGLADAGARRPPCFSAAARLACSLSTSASRAVSAASLFLSFSTAPCSVTKMRSRSLSSACACWSSSRCARTVASARPSSARHCSSAATVPLRVRAWVSIVLTIAAPGAAGRRRDPCQPAGPSGKESR